MFLATILVQIIAWTITMVVHRTFTWALIIMIMFILHKTQKRLISPIYLVIFLSTFIVYFLILIGFLFDILFDTIKMIDLSEFVSFLGIEGVPESCMVFEEESVVVDEKNIIERYVEYFSIDLVLQLDLSFL